MLLEEKSFNEGSKMKTNNILSLVSALVASASLVGCAGDAGKSPNSAQHSDTHGLYWHANPKDSVAKNAYSLAGFDVTFKEEVVQPGGDADNFLSKLLVNGSMGYVTGGLSGLSIMSLGSLYSSSDAEYIQVNQYVVFVPNPKNLPYNDESLVRAGAAYVYNHTQESQVALGFNPSKQSAALASCKIDLAVMNKWSTCDLPSKPGADVMPTSSMYSFQPIRPATGTEIPQLNLPAGEYSVIRYVFIPFKGNESSRNFSGIIFRSDSPKFTTPSGVAASIKGKDYYLFAGEYGQKGFPEKQLKAK
ncbi:Lipoprotein [Escherichia coli]